MRRRSTRGRRRGARRGHEASRADGSGAPDIPSARDPREARGEHRSHQQRPPRAQRRELMVVRRGRATVSSTSTTIVMTHGRVAGRHRRRLDAAKVRLQGQVLSGERSDRRAEARASPAPDDLRWRRVRRGESPDLARVRRVRDARRSAGARRAEDRRHGRAPREAWPGADELRPGRLRHCQGLEAEAQRELERITNVSPGSPGYGNYQDWISHTKLEQQVSLQDYSVSNRGLRAGLSAPPSRWPSDIELENAG